jgi:hypothetical protein
MLYMKICMHFWQHLKQNSLNICQSKECFQQDAVEKIEMHLCVTQVFHSSNIL